MNLGILITYVVVFSMGYALGYLRGENVGITHCLKELELLDPANHPD